MTVRIDGDVVISYKYFLCPLLLQLCAFVGTKKQVVYPRCFAVYPRCSLRGLAAVGSFKIGLMLLEISCQKI